MKKLLFLLCLSIFASCSKNNETCYECKYVNSGGNIVTKNVCTDGDPQDELPDTDANGPIGWGCTKR